MITFNRVTTLLSVLATFSHANLNFVQKNLILSDINIQLSEYIPDHAKSHSVQCLFISH